jgi:hypothetical protein
MPPIAQPDVAQEPPIYPLNPRNLRSNFNHFCISAARSAFEIHRVHISARLLGICLAASKDCDGMRSLLFAE